MDVLPAPVLDEIFDLRYKPTQTVLDHLFDDVENVGLSIKSHVDYDHAVIVIFGSEVISGEIRIDRIRRMFDISAVVNGETILPASGDWGLVIEYLQRIVGHDL